MLDVMDYGQVGEMAGGVHAKRFTQLMRETVKDCRNRPTLSGVRKIIMTVEITPGQMREGRLDDVHLKVKVGAKMPDDVVEAIALVTPADGLAVNLESLDDPNQRTIDDEIANANPPAPADVRSDAPRADGSTGAREGVGDAD